MCMYVTECESGSSQNLFWDTHTFRAPTHHIEDGSSIPLNKNEIPLLALRSTKKEYWNASTY